MNPQKAVLPRGRSDSYAVKSECPACGEKQGHVWNHEADFGGFPPDKVALLNDDFSYKEKTDSRLSTGIACQHSG